MATIHDLLKLDLSKIRHEAVQKSVKGIIDDYNEIESKAVFEKEEETSINKIYQMITKISPNAIIDINPCADPEEEKVKTSKPKKKNLSTKDKNKAIPKKEQTRRVKDKPEQTVGKTEIDELEKVVKECRVKMKIYREEKRKLEGAKPKPTRYAKIKGHMISLGNLIPDRLESNLEVQKESKKLLKSTHRSLLKIYKMNAIRGQKDNEELKERYEKIEDKLEEK
ncbi:hypothetical protein [Aquimarina longa]|uniref:hypothetical protein n=1 Tax=Aquimarina longa TaxID=1080221 RepID=UPI0007814A78|nr:hypothetical protein [Aquimarina longa]